MLNERPRPTQVQIAASTGLTQSRVAKINKCEFTRMSDGVRRVLEYSNMSPSQRDSAGDRMIAIADRIGADARRIAARDPELGEAVADFIGRLASRQERA